MPGPAGLGVGVGHEADPVRGRDLGDQVGDVVAEGVGVAEPEDGVGEGPRQQLGAAAPQLRL